jgi:hypothetical protein
MSKCLLKINKQAFIDIEEREMNKIKYKQQEQEQKEEPKEEQKEEQKEEPKEEPKEEQEEEEFIIDNDDVSIDEQTKKCRCGLEAIVREVKKDGPNKGKLFYCCQQYYDKKCDYFMWKEDSSPVITKVTKVTNINNDTNNSNINDSDINDSDINTNNNVNDKYCKQQQKLGLMCNCKLPSVLREVKKDGPNKGKMFYTCSKNFDDKCKYFVWKE